MAVRGPWLVSPSRRTAGRTSPYRAISHPCLLPACCLPGGSPGLLTHLPTRLPHDPQGTFSGPVPGAGPPGLTTLTSPDVPKEGQHPDWLSLPHGHRFIRLQRIRLPVTEGLQPAPPLLPAMQEPAAGEGQAEEAHPVAGGLHPPRRPGAHQRVHTLEAVAPRVKRSRSRARPSLATRQPGAGSGFGAPGGQGEGTLSLERGSVPPRDPERQERASAEDSSVGADLRFSGRFRRSRSAVGSRGLAANPGARTPTGGGRETEVQRPREDRSWGAGGPCLAPSLTARPQGAAVRHFPAGGRGCRRPSHRQQRREEPGTQAF